MHNFFLWNDDNNNDYQYNFHPQKTYSFWVIKSNRKIKRIATRKKQQLDERITFAISKVRNFTFRLPTSWDFIIAFFSRYFLKKTIISAALVVSLLMAGVGVVVAKLMIGLGFCLWANTVTLPYVKLQEVFRFFPLKWKRLAMNVFVYPLCLAGRKKTYFVILQLL